MAWNSPETIAKLDKDFLIMEENNITEYLETLLNEDVLPKNFNCITMEPQNDKAWTPLEQYQVNMYCQFAIYLKNLRAQIQTNHEKEIWLNQRTLEQCRWCRIELTHYEIEKWGCFCDDACKVRFEKEDFNEWRETCSW